MLNFCVFTFIGYAVAAIIKMLFKKGMRQQDKERRCSAYSSSTNMRAARGQH